MTFQLDTSGSVGEMPGWQTPVPTSKRFLTWSDLSPFTQGYIDAALQELFGELTDENRLGILPCKCGSHPTLSSDGARPDDGKRSMWCQSCLEHVHGWERTESAAIEAWNSARLAEITAAVRYDRLAPETLARIIADCGVIALLKPPERNTYDVGRLVWVLRQQGDLEVSGFRPLTVELGDDGKVRFA